MFLHHFKKKENNLKKHTDNMYLSIIKFIDSLYLNQDYKLKKEFNTSFEITTILIFTIFFAYKQKKYAQLNQILLNTYIEDMDHSLRNLGTDYIDIFHLHGVTPKYFDYAMTLVPKIIKEKEKGKFRFLGITESSPLDSEQVSMTKALTHDCFDVIMFAFSVMNHNAKKIIFPKTVSKNIGTMAMFVVRSLFSVPGRLKNDIKYLVKSKQLPEWFAREEYPLKFILKDSGAKNVMDACYRYVRHEQGVDTVLFGTGNKNHLKENLQSILAPRLSEESIKKINQYFSHLKGVGLDFPSRN